MFPYCTHERGMVLLCSQSMREHIGRLQASEVVLDEPGSRRVVLLAGRSSVDLLQDVDGELLAELDTLLVCWRKQSQSCQRCSKERTREGTHRRS